MVCFSDYTRVLGQRINGNRNLRSSSFGKRWLLPADKMVLHFYNITTKNGVEPRSLGHSLELNEHQFGHSIETVHWWQHSVLFPGEHVVL